MTAAAQVKLSDEVEKWTKRSYSPAAGADCAAFVAACIGALTGDRPLQHLTGTYHTEVERQAFLARQGGIVWAVSAALGDPRAWHWAQRGDVVLLRRGGSHGGALGVCMGERHASFGPDGMSWRGYGEAALSWRVS